MPSRRALLAGAGTVGALGLGVASQSRLGPVAAPEPRPDAWPLARFDAANTAANRRATVPDQPGVAWETPPVGGRGPAALVADRERVYVARDGGTAALDRVDGTVAWTADAGGPLGLSDGTLYVAPGGAANAPTRLRAFDAATGERAWARSTRSEGPTLRATPEVVLFGSESGLAAFDPATGRRRWLDATFREAVPAVAGGSLYAGSGLFDGTVGRYRPRRVADVPARSPPPPAWTVDHAGPGRALAATDDALVAGLWGSTETPDWGGPGWLCLDRDGTERWRGLDPDGGDVSVGPLAVAGERVVAAVRRGDDSPAWRVEARRLADGRVDWSVGVDAGVTDLVVAGDAVLVGRSDTTLVAYALDGRERWRVDLPVTPARLAPVDGTVFVASPAGQVVALR